MQRRSNGKLSYTLGAVNVWSKGLLQPLTGYLGLTLFPCEIAQCGKNLISAFQQFFASIGKMFILAGEMGTGLSFYLV